MENALTELNGIDGRGGVTFEGTVLTMADGAAEAERSVAVRDGRIVSGPEAPADAAVLDFGDRVVMPAFVDPHAHFEGTSLALTEMVDCRAPSHRTVEEVLQTISDHVGDGDTSTWLACQANLFFDQKLEDRRLPTRAELDSISRERPIVIRAGGHRSIINTKGLEVSGVAKHLGRSGMMGGAVVELGPDGEPNGVIAELDKTLGLPIPGAEQMTASLERGARELFLQYGVTSVGEISDSVTGLESMDASIAAGRLPLKVDVLLWAPGTCSREEVPEIAARFPSGAGRGRFAITALKVFSDGGYSARNAATRTPYLEPDGTFGEHRGKVDLSQEELLELLALAEAAGLQLAVHANGERAQDAVCEAILASGGVDPSRPTRIEHAANVLTDLAALELWARAGIVPIPQPVFIYNFGEGLNTYLGDRIDAGRFPFRSILDAGWRISGSSDCYIGCEQEQTNPMFSIWCCVAREGFHGNPVEPDQAVTVDTALRMHTLFAAEALGQGSERGSLEPGKQGDVIVLDRDPRQVPVAELREVKVDFVFIDGRPVFTRPGARPPIRGGNQ